MVVGLVAYHDRKNFLIPPFFRYFCNTLILTIETLKKLDALYEEREDSGPLGGRPTGWGTLVSKLREIRHLVEAGVKVNVEGTQTVLTTWQSFYEWAHGRYHMLEDGYDSWIGDDVS